MSNLFQTLAQRAVRPAAIRPRARSLFENGILPGSNLETDPEVESVFVKPAREHGTAAPTAKVAPDPAVLGRVEPVEKRTEISRTLPEIHRERFTHEVQHETREVLTKEERVLAEKFTPVENRSARVGDNGPTPVPLLAPTTRAEEARREIVAPPTLATPSDVPRTSATPLPAVSPLLIPQGVPLAPPASFSSPEKRRELSTAAPAPAIRVTIGRVEVRAELPASTAPATVATSRKPSSVISLEEYLRQNAGPRTKS